MATNIGIMDSAYFVGRNEILGWINDRLHLNLSRIEEVYIYIYIYIYISFVSACVCFNVRFVFTCGALSNKEDVP